ncbi:MAG: glycosyltransferase [Alphaproteobacteria bacterium]|nr:glycosyltransferase [Alphaproteobacteria bacterium]
MIESRPSLAVVLPSFSGGGAERVVLTIAKALDALGYRVTVIVLNGTGPLKDFVPETIDVKDLSEPRVRKVIRELGRTLSNIAPDVILSTMGYLNIGVVVATVFRPNLRRARIVLREANMPSATAAALGSNFFTRFAYKILFRRASVVLCNSIRMHDELVKFGVDQRCVRQIDNPVDVEGLRQRAIPVRRREGDGPHFVAIGRLVHQKGYDRLFDWMSQNPVPGLLTIIGDGPMRTDLTKQLDQFELSKQVALIGFDSDPAPHLAGADALLLPSRWEGMPNVALEALALGVPVIASVDAGGIDELAVDCPKSIITASDGPSFTEAMRRVTPRRDMNLRPCQLPNRYKLDGVVQQYKEVLFDGL